MCEGYGTGWIGRWGRGQARDGHQEISFESLASLPPPFHSGAYVQAWEPQRNAMLGLESSWRSARQYKKTVGYGIFPTLPLQKNAGIPITPLPITRALLWGPRQDGGYSKLSTQAVSTDFGDGGTREAFHWGLGARWILTKVSIVGGKEVITKDFTGHHTNQLCGNDLREYDIDVRETGKIVFHGTISFRITRRVRFAAGTTTFAATTTNILQPSKWQQCWNYFGRFWIGLVKWAFRRS